MDIGDPLPEDWHLAVARALPGALPAAVAPEGGAVPVVPPEAGAGSDALPDAVALELAILPRGGLSGRPQASKDAARLARAGKANKALARQLAKATREKEVAEQTIKLVVATTPTAAGVLGIKTGTHISRKKVLDVADFLPIVHMAHLAEAAAPAQGVKHARVATTFNDIIMSKQAEGLLAILDRAREETQPGPSSSRAKRVFIHMFQDHVFDGVNLRFRRLSRFERFRHSVQGVNHEIFVQRGFNVTSTTSFGTELEAAELVMSAEPWFVRPVVVDGTSAAAIAPAIGAGQPDVFNPQNADALIHASTSVTPLTLAKTCDKGSGGLLYLKWLIHWFETKVMTRVRNVFLWIEPCVAHGGHRAKLKVTQFSLHTLELGDQAKLSKLQSTQDRIHNSLERLVPPLIRRVVAEPPLETTVPGSLAVGVAILIEPELPRHDRQGGKKSAFAQAALDVCTFFKGSLDGGFFVHYCWVPTRRRACCRTEADTKAKGTPLIINLLTMKTDVVPADSTWAHVTTSLQQNVLR